MQSKLHSPPWFTELTKHCIPGCSFFGAIYPSFQAGNTELETLRNRAGVSWCPLQLSGSEKRTQKFPSGLYKLYIHYWYQQAGENGACAFIGIAVVFG